MRFAVLENNVVINAVIATPEFAAEQGWIALTEEAGIGWSYDGTNWVAPPPAPVPVPQMVTMRQARLALLQAGKLNDVTTAIASLPSPEKDAAQIEWEYATEVSRTSTLVTQLAPVLNLDESALDNLFIEASKL